MNLASLPFRDLEGRLRGAGVWLRTGPVVTRIQSPLPDIAEGLNLLYGDYPLGSTDEFADFHVRLVTPGNLRRWIHPQVLFLSDGRSPFKPLPRGQAFPMLEWGMNWCVANHLHHFLILHAAVIERNGRALIMPGSPGSGKSTLCAALVNRGWRLLSDELTLLSMEDGRVAPLVRPVGLKNASIEVIRRFAPRAVLGRVCADTRKGTVSHMRAPRDSVERAAESALPAWVVMPKYQAEAQGALREESKARMLMRLAENSFNYHILGPLGFALLEDLIERCECYHYRYSDLEQAVQDFDRLSTSVSEDEFEHHKRRA